MNCKILFALLFVLGFCSSEGAVVPGDTQAEKTVQDILDLVNDDLVANIPDFHFYEYDGGHRHIYDGGNDMFDQGNMVKFGSDKGFFQQNPVDYNKVYSRQGQGAWGTKATHPFLAILLAKDSQGDGHTYKIRVQGDAGADGSGVYLNSTGSFSYGVFDVEYDMAQITGSDEKDPTICEVYFTIHSKVWNSKLNAHPVLEHSVGTTALDGNYTLNGKNLLMGYALLSRNNHKVVTEDHIVSVLQRLVTVVSNSMSIDMFGGIVNDTALSPSCSVRDVTEKIHQKCIKENNLLRPQRYGGPHTCRFFFTIFYSCAAEVLKECTWSQPSRWNYAVDVMNLEKYVKGIANPNGILNDELDVFCFHAPAGLTFPYPTVNSFQGFCDADFTDLVRANFALFYREFAWTNSEYTIERLFAALKESMADLIRSKCRLEDLEKFLPADMSHSEAYEFKRRVETFIEVFTNTIEHLE